MAISLPRTPAINVSERCATALVFSTSMMRPSARDARVVLRPSSRLRVHVRVQVDAPADDARPGGKRPAAESAVTLLPLPLSPTMPRVSPRATSRLTPSNRADESALARE